MSDEARIQQLLEEILESNRSAEEVCAHDADLLPVVQQRLLQIRAVSAQLAGLFPKAPPPPAADASSESSNEGTVELEKQQAGPAMFDHYELLEFVGKGNMGVVYKARDTKLQRVVAIKMLAERLAADGTARERFVREARAAAAVRDEHVVGIHAVHDEGPHIYLVMEFISGSNLAEKVKQKGPLELKEILRIGMQTAKGLAAAHQQGLVHRDIKPSNILLENGVQRVKIADFGLARAVDNPNLSEPGLLIGTPAYMSPEQARGARVDRRSDLFSLGSVLYTLCTGRAPFGTDATLAILRRVCEQQPHPILDASPELPEWLAAIVDKLLAKDPEARFQSAAELAELLAQHLADLQSPAPRVARPERARLKSPSTPLQGLPPRRRPVMVLAVAVLALVAGAVSAPWWLPRLQEAPDNTAPLKKTEPQPGAAKPADPRVLTVSKNPKDKAFTTIKAALDAVQPDMTIQILDDAVYDEQIIFDNPARHAGVTLEAKEAKLRHTEKRPKRQQFVILIRDVPRVTLRGLKFISGPDSRSFILLKGANPGVVLDKLAMTGSNGADVGVEIRDPAPPVVDGPPVVIENCTISALEIGVLIDCRDWSKGDALAGDLAKPGGRVVVRNNQAIECRQAIFMAGAISDVHVVSNIIRNSKDVALDLRDFLDRARDVLIANNTLWSNRNALLLCDDSAKGHEFLKCKNIAIRNNLVLDPNPQGDFLFLDHRRGDMDSFAPGDLSLLKGSREWQFSHNWRQITEATAFPLNATWIPKYPSDQLETKIQVESRSPTDPKFLHPPKGSPLGTAGIGGDLPRYVGALPPEGIARWNWNITWQRLVEKLLTVSKNPKDEAQFSTINAALNAVKPDMTIRILDDATYDEQMSFNNPARHAGVTLEAVNKAKLCCTEYQFVVKIQDVPRITLRGLHFLRGPQLPDFAIPDFVLMIGRNPGVVMDRLTFTGGNAQGIAFFHSALTGDDAPVLVQNCKFHSLLRAVLIDGRDWSKGDDAIAADFARPAGRIVIRNNEITGCQQSIFLSGAVYQVFVVGNTIGQSKPVALALIDLLDSTWDILIANNTLWKNEFALQLWDDSKKGHEVLKCKNIAIRNNLILDPPAYGDLFLFDHRRGKLNQPTPGDFAKLEESRDWHFSHNWRELTEPTVKRKDATWIPRYPLEQLETPIVVESREPGHPMFLQPPKGSPLGVGGIGGDLPGYVGALPPEGVERWDWNITWQRLMGTKK